MRQVVGQLHVRHKAGLLQLRRDLIRKKRLYKMAKKKEPTLFGLGMDEGVRTELDRMYKESQQALDAILKRLDNDELIHEIQKRLSISDKELDELTISDDEVERLINSHLLYRKNNAETTPERSS